MITAFFAFSLLHFSAGTSSCLPSHSPLGSFVVMYAGTVMWYCPTMVEAICNAFLIFLILKAARKRASMSHGNESSDVSNKQLAATITVVGVSMFHMAIYVPNGISWVVYSVFADISLSAETITNSYLVAMIFFALGGLVHAANIIVYFTRMSLFRSTLKSLFCSQ
jgi:hypothetical protein